jgi:hypothetical protein
MDDLTSFSQMMMFCQLYRMDNAISWKGGLHAGFLICPSAGIPAKYFYRRFKPLSMSRLSALSQEGLNL